MKIQLQVFFQFQFQFIYPSTDSDKINKIKINNGKFFIGLLLAGVGNIDNTRKSNFMVVDSSSTVTAIEQAFHDLTTRKDIAIVLITQNIADEIRHLLDGYSKPLPAVLEIPSKDMPYNPSKDSILKRAQKMFSVD